MPDHDTDVLRIDNSRISLGEWMRMERFHGNDRTAEWFIERAIIARYAGNYGLKASAEELKEETNQIRRQLNLYGAEETKLWLDVRSLSAGDMLDWAEARILHRKTMSHAAGPHAESYFAANRSRFDRARLYQLAVSTRELAMELRFRCEENEDFFRLAMAFSQDEETRHAGGYMGLIYRDDLPPDEAALIFGAVPGQVIGPFPVPGKGMFRIILIRELIAAEWNADAEERIRERLFHIWLAAERENADIERLV